LVRRESLDASLDELVRRGTLSRAMATLLEQAVRSRASILVVGTQDSAALDMLNALLLAARGHQWLMLSERHEFARQHPRITRLSTMELGTPHALPFAARLTDSALAVENLSGAWVAAGLEAATEGAGGFLAARRAVSLRHGVFGLATDLAAAKATVGLEDARRAVLGAFDLAIEVVRLSDGRDRVLRLVEISTDATGHFEERPLYSFNIKREATGGAIEGNFITHDAEAAIIKELAHRWR
jgi:pilus assembly protein CpaF